MVWNVLAVLCLLGTLVFSVLEVRALMAMARRKAQGESGTPGLGPLIGYSTAAALTLVGFVVFGSLGTLLDGFL